MTMLFLLIWGLGAGNAWIDDYLLSVKINDTWKKIASENFENDKQDSLPENWMIGIGKGESGQSEAHWFGTTSEEAFSGKQSLYVNSSTKSTFSASISLFESYPKPGEYINKTIGNKLKCMVPIALFGTDDYTYPRLNKKAYGDLLKTMTQEIPSVLSGNNHYVRLGNLIITWNIFQHFYPYFDEVKTDWDTSLKEALADCYNNKNEVDFLQTLRKFTAQLHDGHVGVNLEGNTSLSYFLPIQWEWIEKNLIITNNFDPELNIVKGDKVVAIDGLTPTVYFNSVEQYISAATRGWMDYKALQYSLRGVNGSSVTLKLEDVNGAIKTVVLKRTLLFDEHRQLTPYNNKPKFEKLKNGYYYLNLDLITMTEIRSLVPKLAASKGLICDLRGYPNSNHLLVAYLLSEKDTSKSWMRVPQIIYPDFENLVGFKHLGWEIEPAEPHIDCKVVFITDGRAMSYAESFMSFIEHYGLATIVGQPTAGTNGNVNPFVLPGGYKIYWTGMKVVKHDGSQHHGIGILPDVMVNKTIKGIREDRDEFLEKAIEIMDSD